MPNANREILSKYIGEPEREITHISLVQAYGITDDTGFPTLSEGYADVESASKAVAEFVSEAHATRELHAQTVNVRLEAFADRQEQQISITFIRTPHGPSWGLVIEAP